MKTVLQELIENLESNIKGCEIALIDTIDKEFVKGTKRALEDVKIDLENLLEKEKEQIVDACNANLKGLLTNGKDYYDLNFNHHIKSEPNTYTNFTPHDANAVAEYNKGLKNFTSIQLPSDEDI